MSLFSRVKRLFKGPDFDFEQLNNTGQMSETNIYPYAIEILNDERTDMVFVVKLLEFHFGYSKYDATKIMLDIHSKGKMKVGSFREKEAIKFATHLEKQARNNGYPLQIRAVKA